MPDITPEELREYATWIRKLNWFAAEGIADKFDSASDTIERKDAIIRSHLAMFVDIGVIAGGLIEAAGFEKPEGKQSAVDTLHDVAVGVRARIAELEQSIREHRDQKADDRCWMDDQKLYAVLNDGNLGDNTTCDPCVMLENCKRFIERRMQGGEWPSYQELEQQVAVLRADAERYEFIEHELAYAEAGVTDVPPPIWRVRHIPGRHHTFDAAVDAARSAKPA